MDREELSIVSVGIGNKSFSLIAKFGKLTHKLHNYYCTSYNWIVCSKPEAEINISSHFFSKNTLVQQILQLNMKYQKNIPHRLANKTLDLFSSYIYRWPWLQSHTPDNPKSGLTLESDIWRLKLQKFPVFFF